METDSGMMYILGRCTFWDDVPSGTMYILRLYILGRYILGLYVLGLYILGLYFLEL